MRSRRFIDLTGQRYGRLVVVRCLCDEPHPRQRWLACCDCGAEIEVKPNNLRTGHTQSCGCFMRERAHDANVTHGHTQHAGSWSLTYGTWAGMIQRCTNPKHPEYPRYGARGIKVCARWRRFEAFLRDVGERPSRGHSIDRINNNGSYTPGNVRWATASEQARNRRAPQRRG